MVQFAHLKYCRLHTGSRNQNASFCLFFFMKLSIDCFIVTESMFGSRIKVDRM